MAVTILGTPYIHATFDAGMTHMKNCDFHIWYDRPEFLPEKTWPDQASSCFHFIDVNRDDKPIYALSEVHNLSQWSFLNPSDLVDSEFFPPLNKVYCSEHPEINEVHGVAICDNIPKNEESQSELKEEAFAQSLTPFKSILNMESEHYDAIWSLKFLPYTAPTPPLIYVQNFPENDFKNLDASEKAESRLAPGTRIQTQSGCTNQEYEDLLIEKVCEKPVISFNNDSNTISGFTFCELLITENIELSIDRFEAEEIMPLTISDFDMSWESSYEMAINSLIYDRKNYNNGDDLSECHLF